MPYLPLPPVHLPLSPFAHLYAHQHFCIVWRKSRRQTGADRSNISGRSVQGLSTYENKRSGNLFGLSWYLFGPASSDELSRMVRISYTSISLPQCSHTYPNCTTDTPTLLVIFFIIITNLWTGYPETSPGGCGVGGHRLSISAIFSLHQSYFKLQNARIYWWRILSQYHWWRWLETNSSCYTGLLSFN